MSDFVADFQIDQALRDGLRGLPVPPLSPDFDARILSALDAPRPWWRLWWQQAQPVLWGASCSLALTLLLLHWSLQTPFAPPSISPQNAPSPARVLAINRLLDCPNLSVASLSGFAWREPRRG